MTTLTIITVVYNCASGLKRTYDSVTTQTFTDVEWIVIDGGSTDGTAEFIKQHQHHISFWCSEPDNGIYDAMNKGISKATGEWITFLNADDTYTADNILSSIFLKHNIKQTNFIYTDMFLLNANNKPVRAIPAEKLTRYSINKGMIACHQGMFIKREHCPHYHKNLKHQGDLCWVMTILNNLPATEIKHIPIESVYYKSGGYSDTFIFEHLKAHISIIYSQHGWFMIILLCPRLIRRYLGKWVRRVLGIETFRFWIKNR